MTPLTAFRVALSFLTVLPVGPSRLPEALGPSRAYFPLIGLLLGGALAALDIGLRHVLPAPLVGIMIIVALIAATRGLHVEGFLDSCDALLGVHSRERRLEVLKDPHVGSFAIMGGVILVGVFWAAITALELPQRSWVLVLFPALSRWGMLVSMQLFVYARTEGLGSRFTVGAAPWQMVAGLATTLAASILLAGWAGVAMLGLATLTATFFGRWMAGQLGGLTGDSYGAVNEVAGAGVLLLAVALASGAPALFKAPLPTGA